MSEKFAELHNREKRGLYLGIFFWYVLVITTWRWSNESRNMSYRNQTNTVFKKRCDGVYSTSLHSRCEVAKCFVLLVWENVPKNARKHQLYTSEFYIRALKTKYRIVIDDLS